MGHKKMQLTKFEYKALDGKQSSNAGKTKDNGEQAQNFSSIKKTMPPQPVNNEPAPASVVNKLIKYTDEDLSKARTEGFENGYARGYDKAKSDILEIDKAIQASLHMAQEKIALSFKQQEEINNRKLVEFALLSTTLAKKVTGKIIGQAVIEELQNILEKNAKLFFEQQKVNIMVNKSLSSALTDKINNMRQSDSAIWSLIEIKSSDAMPLGACEVQWQGGGIRIDKEVMWHEIERLCNNLG